MSELVLDHLQAVVVELDRRGEIRKVGAHGAARLGYTVEELTSADWFETVIPRAQRAEARRAFMRLFDSAALDEAEPAELHLLTRRGTTLRLAWRERVLGQGEEAYVLGLGMELSDRFSTSVEYQRTAKALRDIRDALDASTIVAITDQAGIITFVNDRFCAVSQYSRAELIGQTHRVVNSGLHPASFFAEMWGTITSGTIWRGDVANRAKDGSIYWVATTIVPFLDERGRPYQYCAIRNEITERKQMEAALIEANRRIREEQAHVIQAEKLSSIGVLAAGVAHEINNPLSGVLACVKALRDQNMVEPRRGEYFETVLDGLERIQTTVRSLLDYARQRSPSPTALAVNELMGAVNLLVTPALRKKDVRVTLDGDISVRVIADRAQLMQALVNVMLNAIFASPAHGEIRVDVTSDAAGATIAVIDEGPGFASESLARVCDPFFTTKPEGEGTGLGLAVTLSVVEGNGGHLDLGNAPGRGARVALWLPRELT